MDGIVRVQSFFGAMKIKLDQAIVKLRQGAENERYRVSPNPVICNPHVGESIPERSTSASPTLLQPSDMIVDFMVVKEQEIVEWVFCSLVEHA